MLATRDVRDEAGKEEREAKARTGFLAFCACFVALPYLAGCTVGPKYKSAAVGDALDVSSPRGSFILQSGERPVVLRVRDFASEFANSQSGLIPFYLNSIAYVLEDLLHVSALIPNAARLVWLQPE